ncbi:MAG: TrmH family RNA methyltransferase [Actinomycetota bacterium]
MTSVRNGKVAEAVKLKKRAFRDERRRFLVEGARGVEEALSAGLESLFSTADVHPVVERARAAGVPTELVSEAVMERLTSTVTPQGIVGVAPFRDVELSAVLGAGGCVALLADVRDPGNAGTILRSADAAGATATVFSERSVDPYNPKVVRASAGSIFRLPLVRSVGAEEGIDALRANGWRALATSPSGSTDLYSLDLSRPTAFVFGNEAAGVPGGLVARCDSTVRIPLPGGAESLNLAAAATLCLFEWARARRGEQRAALETVIASAAHDIRSPLTAMKGFGFTLASRWDSMSDEQRQTMLRGIIYDTERMDSIVKQLVDAARVTGGRLELFPEIVDVGEVVRSLAEAASMDPEHPPIEWRSGDVRAFVDPSRLRVAIAAFIESAIWWAREGPIGISAAVETGRLFVDVERSGAEISAEELNALFAPRAPGSGGGSKIGLFVTKAVAEAQEGSVMAEVSSGALRFRLEVPAPGTGSR